MTQGLIKSSKRKQKLYVKFLKNKTYINEKKYKAYHKLLETIIFKSKKDYYSTLMINTKIM